jgi:hypothetical protein
MIKRFWCVAASSWLRWPLQLCTTDWLGNIEYLSVDIFSTDLHILMLV